MSFWQGKKVFITGHTGLRGTWLSLELMKKKAVVFGYALPPATSPHFFENSKISHQVNSNFSDIRDFHSLKSALEFSQPEIVFHLAGGGGLKQSWQDPGEVYSSQVLGTVNVLEALRETSSVRAVAILSSDKVYRSAKEVCYFKESDPLGGSSPASTAKACTELIVESYLTSVFAPEKFNKHKVALATARMGAVIAGGDYAPDSLIYQLFQAAQSGVDLFLKNPEAVRPWLHIDDAVTGLLSLGQALIERGPKASGAWNFGGGPANMASVGEIKKTFMENYFLKSGLVSAGGRTEVVSAGSDQTISKSRHSGLDSSKALQHLGWSVQTSPQQAVAKVIDWYLSQKM
jgi:CDP-glucose 4,6-dehydratase